MVVSVSKAPFDQAFRSKGGVSFLANGKRDKGAGTAGAQHFPRSADQEEYRLMDVLLALSSYDPQDVFERPLEDITTGICHLFFQGVHDDSPLSGSASRVRSTRFIFDNDIPINCRVSE